MTYILSSFEIVTPHKQRAGASIKHYARAHEYDGIMKFDYATLRRAIAQGGVLCFAGGLLEAAFGKTSSLSAAAAGVIAISVVLILTACVRK